jgi:PTH1 family peptidyl-tRNA hydrolase
MSAIALIAGLGNPGPEYRDTRHNAGFWLADTLAGGDTSFNLETKFHALVCRRQGRGHDYRVIKPTTYMNRSGLAVAAVARFYKIEPAQLLVVHDELDLPPGAARLKRGGGDGGHNGLRDITAQFGTNQYLRLRIGIGHPGSSALVTPYVLGRPSADDREAILSAIEDALRALPLVLDGELQKAMNQLHSPSLQQDK